MALRVYHLVSVAIVLVATVVCPVLCGPGIFSRLLSSQSMNLENLFQAQRNFRRAYDEINEMLMRTVPTDDIEENMKAVSRWIQHFTYDIKEENSNSDDILRALFQIESLADKDPDLCSLSTHQTLVANDKATREFLRRLRPKEVPERRIDKIVHHYAVKQAKECEFHYMTEFESGGMHLDQVTYVRVVQFVGDLITSRVDENLLRQLKLAAPNRLLEDRPFDASRLAENMRFKGKDYLRDGGITNKWLTEFVSQADDPLRIYLNKIRPLEARQKPAIDEKNLSILFQNYLVAPCEEYVKIFHSAFANNLSLVKLNRPLENTDDELIKEFYKHASYWHGCESFIREKNALFSNLKRFITNKGQTVTLGEE